jgi:alcohol dehydrogenase
MGSCVPVRDIPRFMRLYSEGRLPVDRLIDGYIGFDELNAGFDKLQDVKAIRQILTPHGSGLTAQKEQPYRGGREGR